MTSEPAWLAPLDHTADAGFVVSAPDMPALFARAAWGMFDLICDLPAVRPAETVEIEVEASDREALLVQWLSDLNYRHITGHLLFAEFDVHELTESNLRGQARGEPIDPGRHTVYTEVKAVTFHGLKIERTGDLWLAQVIFDL